MCNKNQFSVYLKIHSSFLNHKMEKVFYLAWKVDQVMENSVEEKNKSIIVNATKN